MKTIIYFIRHGEVHNPNNILYGRLPGYPLSIEGKKHIKIQAGYFKDKKIDIIFSSPLLRARQTAKIIGGVVNIKPKISYLLSEVRLIFQGMDGRKYKSEIQPFLYTDKYVKEGQESISEIWQRMEKFIKLMHKMYKGKNILAVSHGDPILILKAIVTNSEFTWEYKRDNYLKTGTWIKTIFDGKEIEIT